MFTQELNRLSIFHNGAWVGSWPVCLFFFSPFSLAIMYLSFGSRHTNLTACKIRVWGELSRLLEMGFPQWRIRGEFSTCGGDAPGSTHGKLVFFVFRGKSPGPGHRIVHGTRPGGCIRLTAKGPSITWGPPNKIAPKPPPSSPDAPFFRFKQNYTQTPRPHFALLGMICIRRKRPRQKIIQPC